MFARDFTRLKAAFDAADASPLGAAALAGTTYPLDRRMTADTLGFSRVIENSLDAVSDRDFLLDLMYACSVSCMHLSRLAEGEDSSTTGGMALSMRVMTPVASAEPSSPVPPISGRSSLRLERAAGAPPKEEPHFGHAVAPCSTSAPQTGHHEAPTRDMRCVTSSAAWQRGHESAVSPTLAPHLGHVLANGSPS